MSPTGTVLIADDEAVLRQELSAFLRERGWRTTEVATGTAAIDQIQAQPFDLIVTDMRMPGADGLAVLKAAQQWAPDASVILVTAFSSLNTAIEALRLGASDYVAKPLVFEDLERKMARLLQHRRLESEIRFLRRHAQPPEAPAGLVGCSVAMDRVRELIHRVAPLDATVLLLGESGTGKERVARALHAASARSAEPFIPVNCGAIPEALFESTLFGHVRGAFTGAQRAGEGLFRTADGGTLFLDEVSTVPIELQPKLLRALEERSIMPVGGTRELSVDVRLVAASNEDLEDAAAAGRFREDLFYRLNVFPIELPPLRDRTDDIPDLVGHFIERFNGELGMAVRGASHEALANLAAYPWKGNVRELANIVQRAMILCDGGQITPAEVPAWHGPGSNLDALTLQEALKEFERGFIQRVLQRHGTRRAAAEALGVSTTTLWRRVKELGLDPGSAPDPE